MTEVIVYSTPTCPWCYKVKDYLKQHKIDFKEVNVAADRVAAKEMVERSGQMGVPVTEINGKMIIGFDKEAIDKELKIKG